MVKKNGNNEKYSSSYDRLNMPQDDVEDMLPHKEMGQLSFEEKKFLLAVERGDVATVRRYVINYFFPRIVLTLWLWSTLQKFADFIVVSTTTVTF